MAKPNKLPLPQATSEAFEKQGRSCQNVGLIFSRYLRFGADTNKWEMTEYWHQNGRPKKRSSKLWNFEQIRDQQSRLADQWTGSPMNKAVIRWQQTVKSQQAMPFKLTPEWRFAVGMGEKTALENGLTFHRIYGFPIIPGSALKGVARAVALEELAETLGLTRLGLNEIKERRSNEKNKKNKACSETNQCTPPLEKLDQLLLAYDERLSEPKQRQRAGKKPLEQLRQEKSLAKLSLDDAARQKINLFRTIFGTPHAAGKALFFDAMPAEAPKLEVDVMTVHHKKYYGDNGEKPTEYPTDSESPEPIFFLTVGQTPFYFAVGWRGAMQDADSQLRSQAESWLQTGLQEFGIGGKTAAGYGYFQPPNNSQSI